jgi:protein-disulfide isomerase
MQFSKKILGVCLLVFGMCATLPTMSAAEQALTDTQRQEIEKIIQRYIMENPKVILESVNRLQQKEQAEKQAQAEKNVSASKNLLLNDPDSPVGGNPNGDVTVVEFFDYRCGYCKRVLPVVTKNIEKDKNVRYVFKEYPILGPESVTASKAAIAVSRIDADKYQPYHKALMAARGSLTKAKLIKVAADIGIDTAALEKEMGSSEIDDIIRKNYELAHSLNITGTPAFVIGTELVPGAIDLETLERLIAEARGS